MKRFIQICSLLSLIVLFTVVSASANTGFGTEVEIPFAFNVGDRSYDAGTYIVRLERLSGSTSALSIQDADTDQIQTVLLSVNSARGGNEMKLVFDTIEGKKYLTKVGTADKTFAVIHTKIDRKREKAANSDMPSAGAVISGGADLF